MEVSKSKDTRLFHLKPVNSAKSVLGNVVSYGRHLVGRIEGADIVIRHDAVSGIHAVLEVTTKGVRIFDMNSTNGTFVNGEKAVVKEVKVGDKVKIADIEFIFEEYGKSEILPPILDSLEPTQGKARIPVNTELPKTPIVEEKDDDGIPYVVYPLAADPKAEFSEYIFEEEAELYPIFKYDFSKQSVEIIILHNDQIYSVDYLPSNPGQYYLKGFKPSSTDVEFPYLRKEEKVPFLNLRHDGVEVTPMPGFKAYHLSDDLLEETNHGTIFIDGQNILRLVNGDIEIYIRNIQAPPKVKPAPFFSRDKDLKKYVWLIFFFITFAAIGINYFEVDEEIEKEKRPERVATILYKRKVFKPKPTEKVTPKPTPKKPEVKPKPKPTKPQKTVSQEKPKPIKVNVKKSPSEAPSKKPVVKKNVIKNATQKTKSPNKEVVKAKPNPSPKPQTRKAPPKKTLGAKTKSSPTQQKRFSKTPRKTVGRVDTYQSKRFKSTISTMLAKGGSLSGVKTKSAATGFTGGASVGGGSTAGKGLKSAGITSSAGSFTGSTVGTADTSTGAEGLSEKAGIYTAGIPSETVVLGSMDPDVIRRILREHIPQFRYCYQRALDSSGSTISGIVKMDFIIGASGSVSRASATGSQIPSKVRGCISGVLRGIQFPRPLGGGQVEVSQPLNLSAKKI